MARTASQQADLLRVFIAAVDSVNFREAALRLAVSPQVVSRAVRQLEEELGEPLFHRSTRRVNITRFGENFAQSAREVLSRLEGLFDSGRSRPGEAGGTVRLTVVGVLGRHFLLPALAECLKRHPDLRLDIRVSDLIEDVVDAQIDIGVRIGSLRDNGFVARAVAPVRFYVAATPECIAAGGGPPADLDGLRSRPCTVLVDRNNGRGWPWIFSKGRQFVPAAPALVTDDPETEMAAVLGGLGYGQVPGFLARPHLRSGRLQAVLENEAPDPWHVYVYRPQRGPVPARLRVVFDALVDRLGDEACLPVSA